MKTDRHWQQWGRTDPYYGVLTDQRFRLDQMDEQARADFFASGEQFVDRTFRDLQQLGGVVDRPGRALDFGCGVGRLLIPLARRCDQAVGVDISSDMLREAGRNCASEGLRNVHFEMSDDHLSALADQRFDLIVTDIVIQHLPARRGRRVLANLLDHLAPGGSAAIGIKYGEQRRHDWVSRLPGEWGWPPVRKPSRAQAPMAMNAQSLDWVMKQLHARNVTDVRVRLDQMQRSLTALVMLVAPQG